MRRWRTNGAMGALIVLLGGCSRGGGASSEPARAGPQPQRSVTGQSILRGRVRLEGALALPPIPTNASAARQCGATLEDRSIAVDPAGGLSEAVVALDDPGLTGPAPARGPTLDQRQCAFVPEGQGAYAGAPVALLNGDSLLHNVRAFTERGSGFNVALPFAGLKMARPLPPEPGRVDVRCDVHPWMRAVLWTFAHPYFTSTAADGTFELKGLPAGRHAVIVHHLRLPDQRATVDLAEGSAADLQFVFKASDVTRD